VNTRDRLEHIDVAAEATDAIVATLSVRLDALLATWQRAIQLEGNAPAKRDKAKPRPTAEVLSELQGQVNHLDLLIDKLQREVDSEKTLANDWEQRAILCLRDNREDLAKQALIEVASHATTAASQESELMELHGVREAYRNAVAAVEASLEGRPDQS